MTDYYTQFSIGIKYKKKAREWLDEKLNYYSGDEYDQEVFDNGEANWGIDHEFDDDKGYLYLSSEVAPDLDKLVEVLQEYLQKFDPKGFISVTWADFCSKLHVDTFGGGAAAITAKEVKYCNIYEFVAQERAEHKDKRETQQIIKKLRKGVTRDKKKPSAKRNT
jgi:hypothetical protein